MRTKQNEDFFLYDKKVVESQIVFISFFKTNMDIASTTKRVRFHAETVSVWVCVCVLGLNVLSR